MYTQKPGGLSGLQYTETGQTISETGSLAGRKVINVTSDLNVHLEDEIFLKGNFCSLKHMVQHVIRGTVGLALGAGSLGLAWLLSKKIRIWTLDLLMVPLDFLKSIPLFGNKIASIWNRYFFEKYAKEQVAPPVDLPDQTKSDQNLDPAVMQTVATSTEDLLDQAKPDQIQEKALFQPTPGSKDDLIIHRKPARTSIDTNKYIIDKFHLIVSDPKTTKKTEILHPQSTPHHLDPAVMQTVATSTEDLPDQAKPEQIQEKVLFQPKPGSKDDLIIHRNPTQPHKDSIDKLHLILFDPKTTKKPEILIPKTTLPHSTPAEIPKALPAPTKLDWTGRITIPPPKKTTKISLLSIAKFLSFGYLAVMGKSPFETYKGLNISSLPVREGDVFLKTPAGKNIRDLPSVTQNSFSCENSALFLTASKTHDIVQNNTFLPEQWLASNEQSPANYVYADLSEDLPDQAKPDQIQEKVLLQPKPGSKDDVTIHRSSTQPDKDRIDTLRLILFDPKTTKKPEILNPKTTLPHSTPAEIPKALPAPTKLDLTGHITIPPSKKTTKISLLPIAKFLSFGYLAVVEKSFFETYKNWNIASLPVREGDVFLKTPAGKNIRDLPSVTQNSFSCENSALFLTVSKTHDIVQNNTFSPEQWLASNKQSPVNYVYADLSDHVTSHPSDPAITPALPSTPQAICLPSDLSTSNQTDSSLTLTENMTSRIIHTSTRSNFEDNIVVITKNKVKKTAKNILGSILTGASSLGLVWLFSKKLRGKVNLEKSTENPLTPLPLSQQNTQDDAEIPEQVDLAQIKRQQKRDQSKKEWSSRQTTFSASKPRKKKQITKDDFFITSPKNPPTSLISKDDIHTPESIVDESPLTPLPLSQQEIQEKVLLEKIKHQKERDQAKTQLQSESNPEPVHPGTHISPSSDIPPLSDPQKKELRFLCEYALKNVAILSKQEVFLRQFNQYSTQEKNYITGYLKGLLSGFSSQQKILDTYYDPEQTTQSDEYLDGESDGKEFLISNHNPAPQATSFEGIAEDEGEEDAESDPLESDSVTKATLAEEVISTESLKEESTEPSSISATPKSTDNDSSISDLIKQVVLDPICEKIIKNLNNSEQPSWIQALLTTYSDQEKDYIVNRIQEKSPKTYQMLISEEDEDKDEDENQITTQEQLNKEKERINKFSHLANLFIQQSQQNEEDENLLITQEQLDDVIGYTQEDYEFFKKTLKSLNSSCAAAIIEGLDEQRKTIQEESDDE